MIRFRCFPTQATTFLNATGKPEYLGPDSVEMYILYNDGLAATKTAIDLAHSRGYHVVPGDRYFAASTLTVGSWVDRAWWQTVTYRTRSVAFMRSAHPRSGRATGRFSFDLENYFTNSEGTSATLATIGATEDDLAYAMRPLLDLVEELDIIPCIYPVEDASHVAAKLLFEAAGGRGEQMPEATYGFPGKYNTYRYLQGDDQLALADIRRALRFQIPSGDETRIQMIPGYQDYVLRAGGAGFRSDMLMRNSQYTPQGDCWIYLEEQTDSSILGSSSWVSGASLSTLNTGIVYNFGFTSGTNEPDKITGASMQYLGVNNAGSEVTSGSLDLGSADYAFRGPGFRFFRQGFLKWTSDQHALSVASPLFLDFEFWHDAFHEGFNKPIASFSAYNNKSNSPWRLYWDYTSTKLVLQTRRADGTVVTAQCTNSPTPQLWNRVQVGLSANTAKLTFGGETVFNSNASALRTGAQDLYLGYGFDGHVTLSTPIFGHNMAIRRLHIWNRAQAAGEDPENDGAGIWPFNLSGQGI